MLGRLVHLIRKETNVTLEVSTLFNNSTVAGIADLVDYEQGEEEDEEDDFYDGYDDKGALGASYAAHRYDEDEDVAFQSHGYKPRSQTHPWVLFIQAIPFLFFYPFKAAWTWTVILHGLAFSAFYIRDIFWERVGALLASILVARLTSRIICPITAIAFKWIVIGRYRPGKYPMWCNYHLRWWIVNQSLKTAGKGLFAATQACRRSTTVSSECRSARMSRLTSSLRSPSTISLPSTTELASTSVLFVASVSSAMATSD